MGGVSSGSVALTHTHTHIHTMLSLTTCAQILSHIYVLCDTHMLIHIHTCSHMLNTHTCSLTHAHTCTLCSHTCSQKFTHIHALPQCSLIFTLSYIHAFCLTHIHTHSRTYPLHSYTHSHTGVPKCSPLFCGKGSKALGTNKARLTLAAASSSQELPLPDKG